MKIVLTLAATLASANALADDTPAYVEPAWRMRLVTMAPACKLRDAVWAAKVRGTVEMNVINGLPSDRVLSVRVPQQESLKEAEGAMAMAADQGANIVRNVGPKICAPLIRPLALTNTDKMVEDAQKQGFDGKDPGFAVKLPLSVRRKAWVASQISMEVACHLRSEESSDRLYATLIVPVSEAAKESMPDQKPEDAVSVGLGAMQMAYFMGTRLQADLPESVCDYVRTAAARKPTRQLEHDQAAIEAKVIAALPTPDD